MTHASSRIRPFAHLRVFKKGANIFFQGEAPRHGAMIADGIARSYTITSSGEERTLAFFTKDDILPLSWLMETTSFSLFYYEAVTDVRLLQFSREDFKAQVLRNPDAIEGMFATLASDHTAAMLRVNGLAQSRAEDKVAFTLYYLVFRYGQQQDNGQHVISIPLRHTMIAGLVGLSRESTTKILGKLQKQGIIDYSGSTYKVDKTQLESYIGEDAFRDVVLR